MWKSVITSCAYRYTGRLVSASNHAVTHYRRVETRKVSSTTLLPTIICTSKLDEAHTKELNDQFNVLWADEYFQRENKLSKDIVGCIAGFPYLQLIMEQIQLLPNLKVISAHSAGVDGLDITELHRLNIRVSNLPHLVHEPTADMAFALMLATARQLKQSIQASKHPDIEVRTSLYYNAEGSEVSGATIGIIGMGGIGHCVARRAMGFGMKTLYYNRNRRPELEEQSVNAEYCSSLEELLTLSDFLVIAVPLTAATTNLIGQKELAIMKPTASLINVSRGCVVDTTALVDALRNGTIASAGLDVTEPEPLPHDHPLVHMDNVILSGHSGTSTRETANKMINQAFENLKAGLTSRPMNNEVFPSSESKSRTDVSSNEQ